MAASRTLRVTCRFVESARTVSRSGSSSAPAVVTCLLTFLLTSLSPPTAADEVAVDRAAARPAAGDDDASARPASGDEDALDTASCTALDAPSVVLPATPTAAAPSTAAADEPGLAGPTAVQIASADDLASLAGDEPSRPRYEIKPTKIYFGEPKKFARPAVLEALKVYRTIPAYRTIQDRGLTRDDPEYAPLIRRTSALFLKGLKLTCSKQGYDLVGEIGAITPSDEDDTVPDITDVVIGAVKADGQIVRGAGDLEDLTEDEELEGLLNLPELD